LFEKLNYLYNYNMRELRLLKKPDKFYNLQKTDINGYYLATASIQ